VKKIKEDFFYSLLLLSRNKTLSLNNKELKQGFIFLFFVTIKPGNKVLGKYLFSNWAASASACTTASHFVWWFYGTTIIEWSISIEKLEIGRNCFTTIVVEAASCDFLELYQDDNNNKQLKTF
jgi:hypothetical protein